MDNIMNTKACMRPTNNPKNPYNAGPKNIMIHEVHQLFISIEYATQMITDPPNMLPKRRKKSDTNFPISPTRFIGKRNATGSKKLFT